MISILRQRAVKHSLLNIVKARYTKASPEQRSELYFGYGANLSLNRFTSRKMNVEEVGNAQLKDYEIRFTLANEYKPKGYAGVHKAPGQSVWGVLYKMDKLSLKLLDTLEWCGYGAYERTKVSVTLADGTEQECWCYFVKFPFENLFPSKIYLNNMIKAAKERGFPEDYIGFLEAQEYREDFELDHGFSLLFYGKRRWLSGPLKPIYRIHDLLREKLSHLI